jgi:hypothetical protein
MVVAIIMLIVMLVAAILAIASMPGPPSQKPGSLADLQVPTAEDGREVVDIAGTCWIDDPNVIYYGNPRQYPVKAKT